jgi:hypothetical protein
MFWNTPEYKTYESPTFKETVTTISYNLTEDEVSKYWYNRGHEDGRKLAVRKTVTDEEILDAFEIDADPDREFLVKSLGVENLLRRARALLKKASE